MVSFFFLRSPIPRAVRLRLDRLRLCSRYRFERWGAGETITHKLPCRTSTCKQPAMLDCSKISSKSTSSRCRCRSERRISLQHGMDCSKKMKRWRGLTRFFFLSKTWNISTKKIPFFLPKTWVISMNIPSFSKTCVNSMNNPFSSRRLGLFQPKNPIFSRSVFYYECVT